MAAVNLKQRLIGAVVLVALAIIFLPMLMNNAKESKLKLQSIPEAPTKPVVQSVVPVISAPATDNKQNVSSQAAKAWALQLGTFSNPINAQVLVKRLLKQGFTAYSVPATAGSQKVLKVYIGPELDLKKLQGQAEQLEKKFKLDSKIIPFSVPTIIKEEK